MNTELYIGTEQADFNDIFNVMFSIGDIRNQAFGNSNKTYTIKLPLTKKNKRLIKFINQIDVKSEPSAKGWLFTNGQLIISGNIIIYTTNDNYAKISINADEWIDARKDVKLTELDLSASDHALTKANIEASWSASYPVYRYPMINFGGLQSGEYGSSANWYPTDFIPMISVVALITEILAPYTISSALLATGFFKDLYILAHEFISDSDFIQNKALDMKVQTASDNEFSDTIDTDETKDFTLTDAVIDLNTGTDEGLDYDGPNNWYLVPETGTYHFTFDARPTWTTFVGVSINSQQQIIAIKRTRDASTITLVTQTTDYVDADILNGTTYSIATGYVHLEAGDKIFATRYMTQNLSNVGVQRTITMNYAVTVTKLYLTWGEANRYSGLNKNISLEEMLPNITQLDFLAAIRDIFNLRFWTDKQKQVIYIEPWDQFLSDTVIDIRSYIDFENIDSELISPNYDKTIVLKWKDDDSDTAYKEYLKINQDGPGRKEINLTSIFAKQDITISEHPFSSIITGYNAVISEHTTPVPQIFNEMPIPPYEFDRKTGFNTRIVEWKGLTGGFTWYIDGDEKTTYPKVDGLDFEDIYSSYLMKFFHYIDKGKLIILKIKVKPGFLTQFLTVVNNAEDEGFRPVYRITKDGVDNYCFLQKITSDGDIAELELILK